MEITHINNSFISVKVGKTVIFCDPWIGQTNDNAWLSFPIYKDGHKSLKNLKPNFIYISHLHCDHFNPTTLAKYKSKNIQIVIKKFNDQRLKKKLLQNGFKNIIECKNWKKYKLNQDISISIIPQMTNNSSGIESQIEYDLDTSILIQSNISKKVFFNNVDNPLSLSDLKKIKSFTKKNLKSNIDVACFPVGAASEYPQCFLNINRKKEKNTVIKNSLLKLKLKLEIIKPKVFFPAGGTYIISGKYSALNKYIAQPSYSQIKDFLKKEKYQTLDIQGGKKIYYANERWIEDKIKYSGFKIKKNKIIKIYSKKNYYYTNKDRKIKLNDLNEMYYESFINYKKKLINMPIKTAWSLEFYLYDNLIINDHGNINFKKSKLLKKYKLNHNIKKTSLPKINYSVLKCHLDFNLFYGLLRRKYIWNIALSGSLILYERQPNKFDPNQVFSLNYLAA